MANDIARFFESQPEAGRVEAMAQHLSDFWDPVLRREFLAVVAAGGPGLRALALAAAPRVRRPPER